MATKPRSRKATTAPRKAKTQSRAPRTGDAQYDAIKARLERDHFGAYVMINTATAEYVVAPTTSEVHSRFIEAFGEHARGWCTRIGASVFATA